jgi:hypothetical protein
MLSLHPGVQMIKRFISAGLSMVVLSALSASAVKAQTRYEYQLGLTHHSIPTSTQKPAQIVVQMPVNPQTQLKSNELVRPVTSGNPYTGRDRLIYERQNQVVLPPQ